jgi:hypothetical protein
MTETLIERLSRADPHPRVVSPPITCSTVPVT